ncbi:MAG: replication initiator protein A [Lachnospiraceae bacterium]
MKDITGFNYYYGEEAGQFPFFRIPKHLIKDQRFKGLSSDAKLLYGLMLDRLALSIKNGWHDDKNRIYIYYTTDNIMEDLCCSKTTCTKILAELDSKKGLGLIERKRQGLGRPDIIYVKNFVTTEQDKTEVNKPDETEPDKPGLNIPKPGVEEHNTINRTRTVTKQNFTEDVETVTKQNPANTTVSIESKYKEIQKPCFQKPVFFDSANKENRLLESKKTDPNNTDINNTGFSYTINTNHISSNNHTNCNRQPDITQEKKKDRLIEKTEAYTKIIKNNIEYDFFMEYGTDKELYNELFEIIREVVCVDRETIRIGGNNYPYNLVKSRFLKLDNFHLGYVINCMKKTTKKIKNIKAYIITALYNATCTINHYYQQEVQHDMHNACCQETAYI